MPGPGRRFQKGQSGNPTGRPKQDKPVIELARAHGPRAIEVLAELMNDSKATAAARAMAAEKLLDRGYGKPPQFSTGQASEFRKAVDLTDDELAAIVAGGRQAVVAHLVASDGKTVGQDVGRNPNSSNNVA